jgi:hypothetical protein
MITTFYHVIKMQYDPIAINNSYYFLKPVMQVKFLVKRYITQNVKNAIHVQIAYKLREY